MLSVTMTNYPCQGDSFTKNSILKLSTLKNALYIYKHLFSYNLIQSNLKEYTQGTVIPLTLTRKII